MDGLQPTQPSVLRQIAQNRRCTCPGDRSWPCAVCAVDLIQLRSKAHRAAAPLCKGRLRHSPLLPSPPTAGFSFQLVKHPGKQIRSHLTSLHDAGSVTEVHGPIPSQSWSAHVTPTPKQTSLLLRLTLYLSSPSAFYVWTSQEQMTARSLPVILEFPKVQLLSN